MYDANDNENDVPREEKLKLRVVPVLVASILHCSLSDLVDDPFPPGILRPASGGILKRSCHNFSYSLIATVQPVKSTNSPFNC